MVYWLQFSLSSVEVNSQAQKALEKQHCRLLYDGERNSRFSSTGQDRFAITMLVCRVVRHTVEIEEQ